MKIIRKCFFLGILFASFSGNLFATDQFLDVCLKFAQARDKKLAVAEEQIRLSMTRVTKSIRSFLPNLSAERKYSKGMVFNGTSDETGEILVEEWQSENLGLRAQLSLYEGGRIKYSYKYDSLMFTTSKYNYTKTREELFYKIKVTYYEFLTVRMEQRRLQATLDEIDKLAARVRLEYKAKAISELELIEAENFRDKVSDMLYAAELNLSLTKRRLASLVHVESIDDVPVLLPEGLPEDVPEISYILDECISFALTNNLDLKIESLQLQMANYKRKIVRSKVIPKLSVDGFYGRSGEAYVSDPIPLASAWNVMGKLSWGLWGNSMELENSSERTNPNEATSPNAKFDTTSYDVKFSIFDDLAYFVNDKEAKVNFHQAQATYDETEEKVIVELEKSYNDYRNSLNSARTLKNEIDLKERKLKLLRKRNQLYEVSTLQVMEETLRYAETITAFSKAMYTNYANVANMEKITLVPLR